MDLPFHEEFKLVFLSLWFFLSLSFFFLSILEPKSTTDQPNVSSKADSYIQASRLKPLQG
jgi:hypothetical protein